MQSIFSEWGHVEADRIYEKITINTKRFIIEIFGNMFTYNIFDGIITPRRELYVTIHLPIQAFL